MAIPSQFGTDFLDQSSTQCVHQLLEFGFCDNFIEKALLCLYFSCWNLQITTTTPRLLRHQQIHVVLKHQKICTHMHNAQGQDRVKESVCTCNKKIALFIYSFTLAISWTSTMHPQIIQMCKCHPSFNPILIPLQQIMSFSLFFYLNFNQNRHWTHLDSMKKCQLITTCNW
jgi:hypothetical protein